MEAKISRPRGRSVSAGRDKKSELQARYWAFLFENLQRAVDEVYQTCETDESITECKEVILVLENFTRDFHNLIEWFRVKWDYENPAKPNRSSSLAWEVKKSTPGKVSVRRSIQTPLANGFPEKYMNVANHKDRTNLCDPCLERPSGPKKYKPGFMFEYPTHEQHLSENEYTATAQDANYSFRKWSSDPSICSINESIETPFKQANFKDGDTSQETYSSTRFTIPINYDSHISKANIFPPISKELNVDGLVFGDIILEEASKTNEKNVTDGKKSIILKDSKNVHLCHLFRSTTDPIILKYKKAKQTNLPKKESPCSINQKDKKVLEGNNVKADAHKLKSDERKNVLNKVLSLTQAPKSKPTVSKLSKISQRSMQQFNGQSEPRTSTKNSVRKLSIPFHLEIGPSNTIASELAQHETSVNTTNINTMSKVSLSAPVGLGTNLSNLICSFSYQNSASNTQSKLCGASQHKSSLGKNVAAPVFVPKVPITILKHEYPTGKTSFENECNEKILKIKGREIKEEKIKSTRPETHAESLKAFFNKVKNSTLANSVVDSDIANFTFNNELHTSVDTKEMRYVRGTVFGVGQNTENDIKKLESNISESKKDKENLKKYKLISENSKDSLNTNFVYEASKNTSMVEKDGVIKNSLILAPSQTVVSVKKVNKACNTELDYDEYLATNLNSNKHLIGNFNGGNINLDSCGISVDKCLSSKEHSIESLKSSESSAQLSISDESMISVHSNRSWPPLRSNTSLTISNRIKSGATQVLAKRNSIPLAKEVQKSELFRKQTQRICARSNNVSSYCTPNVKYLAQRQEKLKRPTVTKDPDGWETVTGRSRCRNGKVMASLGEGEVKTQSQATQISLSASHLNTEPGKMFDAKRSFQMPSPALSLPSLSSLLSFNHSSTVTEKDRGDGPYVSEREKKSPIISIAGGVYQKRKKQELKKKGKDETQVPSKPLSPLPYVHTSKSDSDSDDAFTAKKKHLEEKAALLNKEIQDLESTYVDFDDGKVIETLTNRQSLEATYGNVLHGMSTTDQSETLDKLEELLELDQMFKNIAWDERKEKLDQLEDAIKCRHPGRAGELHQKLSQPLRTQSIPEMIRSFYSRQSNAQQKREQFRKEKSHKLRELLNKVEEVRVAQNQLISERREQMNLRMQKAADNRSSYLIGIQKKAHDEEKKGREIAFINELEAQNKRHEFLIHCQEQEDRLQEIFKERAIRQERKAEKEAAVEKRKKMIEAKRQEKLEKLKEKRRIKEERIGREFLKKEKVRLELAREKEIDRQERRQALNAAKLANVEELQKKIQTKLEESAKRHEMNIEQIKKKASVSVKLSENDAPESIPYEAVKMCSLCGSIIRSEVHLQSHLKGKFHLDNLRKVSSNDIGSSLSVENDTSFILDAPTEHANSNINAEKDRKKYLRKKCKKVRAKLLNNSFDFESGQPVLENGKKPQNDNQVCHEKLSEKMENKDTLMKREVKENKPRKKSKIESNLLHSVENHITASSDVIHVNNERTLTKKQTESIKEFKLVEDAKACGIIESRADTLLIQDLNQVLSLSVSSSNTQNKMRIVKCLQDIDKLLTSQGISKWSSNNILALERNLTELIRVFKNSKSLQSDQLVFQTNNGLNVFLKFLKLAVVQNTSLSVKPFLTCVTCLLHVCKDNVFTCISFLYTQNIVCLCDLVNEKLSIVLESNNVYNSPNESQYYIDPLCGMLLSLLTDLLSTIVKACGSLECDRSKLKRKRSNQSILLKNAIRSKMSKSIDTMPKNEKVIEETNSTASDGKSPSLSNGREKNNEFILSKLFERLQDVINYTICSEIVDKISQFCNYLCCCIDSNPNLAQFLENCINLLNALTKTRLCVVRYQKKDQSPLLENTIVQSEMFGTMSMLYGTLLHQDAPPRDTNFPPAFVLPQSTLHVIHATLSLLNTVASLQLKLFQDILGAEGISLQLRHIATYLLWYCSSDLDTNEENQQLLHLVIQLVGYFAVNNHDNQLILQSGFTPTVLRQLCSLPFSYFSQPDLTMILFPTLLACCHGNNENRKILNQELCYEMLQEFAESSAVEHILLMKLLKN